MHWISVRLERMTTGAMRFPHLGQRVRSSMSSSRFFLLNRETELLFHPSRAFCVVAMRWVRPRISLGSSGPRLLGSAPSNESTATHVGTFERDTPGCGPVGAGDHFRGRPVR